MYPLSFGFPKRERNQFPSLILKTAREPGVAVEDIVRLLPLLEKKKKKISESARQSKARKGF